MNFENMSTIKIKFTTYHAITELWSSVYKQIAVFSKTHPSFFANYLNTENNCLTGQHIFKAELHVVSKSLCAYFKFEIMSGAKRMVKKKEHSPWAINNPFPPEGIFKAMIFWKRMKNATIWALFALWLLGL
jgi:hypothetical protein